MKDMGWGVPPFLLEDYIGNVSSRKLLEEEAVATDTPKYRIEADPTEGVFNWSVPVKTEFKWFTFTNTGRETLTDIEFSHGGGSFIVHAFVPRHLKRGESFRVRVMFYPEEPNISKGYLRVRNREVSLTVPLEGVWDYVGLIHDGSARYNGMHYYGGNMESMVFYFDGSEFANGKYPATGIKYNG